MTAPVPPVLPPAFATAAELAAYWGRTLSESDQARADFLLTRAALRILELPGSADFDPLTCNDVSLDMVKRAMIGGGGVNQQSQAMADMNANVLYSNPMGNLYITQEERDRLYGHAPIAASITPASNVRVPLQIWNWQPTLRRHHGQDDESDGCDHAGNQP